MSERVAVIGAREHPDLEMVRAYVRTLPAGTLVISGGADGVDACAVEGALASGLEALAFLPHSGDGRPVTGHRLDVQRVEQVAVEYLGGHARRRKGATKRLPGV